MFLDKRRVLRVNISDDDLTSAKTSSETGRAVHFKEPIQTWKGSCLVLGSLFPEKS